MGSKSSSVIGKKKLPQNKNLKASQSQATAV
jgi:hypothetical protein